ncbi:hypothetical protein L873DRAFT_1811618, partial [Choiromyces venosus 120613-1]
KYSVAVLVASPLIQFSKVWPFSLPHVFFPATNDSTPARQTPLSEFLLSYQEKKKTSTITSIVAKKSQPPTVPAALPLSPGS